MNFINRLREKPTGTKKVIAITTSAVVTLAIFGIWASVLNFGATTGSSAVTAAVAKSSDTDVNPFSAFWEVVSKGWGGLSKDINQTKTGADDSKGRIETVGLGSPNVVSSTSQKASQEDVFILTGDSEDGGDITQ